MDMGTGLAGTSGGLLSQGVRMGSLCIRSPRSTSPQNAAASRNTFNSHCFYGSSMRARLGCVLHRVSHRLQSRGGLGPHLKLQPGQDPVQTRWPRAGVRSLVAVGRRLPRSSPRGPFPGTAPNAQLALSAGEAREQDGVGRGCHLPSVGTSPHFATLFAGNRYRVQHTLMEVTIQGCGYYIFDWVVYKHKCPQGQAGNTNGTGRAMFSCQGHVLCVKDTGMLSARHLLSSSPWKRPHVTVSCCCYLGKRGPCVRGFVFPTSRKSRFSCAVLHP